MKCAPTFTSQGHITSSDPNLNQPKTSFEHKCQSYCSKQAVLRPRFNTTGTSNLCISRHKTTKETQ